MRKNAIIKMNNLFNCDLWIVLFSRLSNEANDFTNL